MARTGSGEKRLKGCVDEVIKNKQKKRKYQKTNTLYEQRADNQKQTKNHNKDKKN